MSQQIIIPNGPFTATIATRLGVAVANAMEGYPHSFTINQTGNDEELSVILEPHIIAGNAPSFPDLSPMLKNITEEVERAEQVYELIRPHQDLIRDVFKDALDFACHNPKDSKQPIYSKPMEEYMVVLEPKRGYRYIGTFTYIGNMKRAFEGHIEIEFTASWGHNVKVKYERYTSPNKLVPAL